MIVGGLQRARRLLVRRHRLPGPARRAASARSTCTGTAPPCERVYGPQGRGVSDMRVPRRRALREHAGRPRAGGPRRRRSTWPNRSPVPQAASTRSPATPSPTTPSCRAAPACRRRHRAAGARRRRRPTSGPSAAAPPPGPVGAGATASSRGRRWRPGSVGGTFQELTLERRRRSARPTASTTSPRCRARRRAGDASSRSPSARAPTARRPSR